MPDRFHVRRIVVAPGAERPFVEGEWRDAVVLVEAGWIELACRGGSRRRFRRGDVLWLIGLPLLTLHNRGRVPTVLVAVSRRRPSRPSAPTPVQAGDSSLLRILPG